MKMGAANRLQNHTAQGLIQQITRGILEMHRIHPSVAFRDTLRQFPSEE